MISLPSSSGILVLLVGTLVATQTALVGECVAAGVDEPILQGVQLDGSPGGDPTLPPAPSGQAYCTVLLDDAATPQQQNAVLQILSAHAPPGVLVQPLPALERNRGRPPGRAKVAPAKRSPKKRQ